MCKFPIKFCFVIRKFGKMWPKTTNKISDFGGVCRRVECEREFAREDIN